MNDVSWYRDISSIVMKKKDRNRLQSNKVQTHFLEKGKGNRREGGGEKEREKGREDEFRSDDFDRSRAILEGNIFSCW